MERGEPTTPPRSNGRIAPVAPMDDETIAPVRGLLLADELAAAFVRMSGLLLTEETAHSALSIVVSLVRETVPGCIGVGVTVLDDQGRRTTAAASGPLPERADSIQYALNEGPCLRCCADRILVRVDDLLDDDRWPRWAEAVRPLGVRSSLSAPLVAGGTALGAITVYGEVPGAFGEREEYLLTMFATQAAILLAHVSSHVDARQLGASLSDALRGREVIAVAKGILMARDATDEDTAFATLIALSRRDSRKLRDVASMLLRTTTARHGR
jgi:GAF domain-containing protein